MVPGFNRNKSSIGHTQRAHELKALFQLMGQVWNYISTLIFGSAFEFVSPHVCHEISGDSRLYAMKATCSLVSGKEYPASNVTVHKTWAMNYYCTHLG